MKVTIIPIGNSRGVRLPKAVLDQCGFADEAELSVENGRVVIAPLAAPRSGWAEAFAAEPAAADDAGWLDAPLADESGWTWPKGSKSGS
ncbi:MAG: AbrB/MazE/SpoVT family DNA-binding domain-containing protein [Alphaproteobacteria bacterium]|nr:AbrB/MazE/SpoVT family DNA-binding domain-containing protein [Alphaproteobacteria bacterium]